MSRHPERKPDVPESRISRRRQAALVDGNEAYRLKRQELIHIAATIFQEKGFGGATLNDIAERFGTDRASLYYYVSGKDELLREAVRGVVKDNLDEAERILALDIRPADKLRRLVTQLVTSYERAYPSMYVYIQEDMSKVAHEDSAWARDMMRHTRRITVIATTIISQGVKEGDFRDDISPSLAANGIFGMVNWTHRWFKPGRSLTAERIAEAFSKIFLEGMSAS